MRVCPECGNSTDQDTCPNDGRPTVDAAHLKVEAGSDPFVGRTLADRYVVEEKLGRGGYGAVYRARHVETGGAVAVKLVRADLVDDEMVIRRFYIEAQNTHKLHHPNTVRVADFGRTPDGVLYLVMEFVKGVSLQQLIRAEGPLAPDRAVRIIVQVLKSLGEAHGYKLVHRDVKPQNIMLIDQFGEPDFVKLLDFGISRALDSTGASTKGLLGTPRYMAPEQWRSLPVDGRTDLYAAGCILYEMLTRRFPFEVGHSRGKELAVAYMTAHVAKPPTPLDTFLGDQFPRELGKLVMEMLAKKKADRPANAETVLKRLTDISRATPLSTESPRLSHPGPIPSLGHGDSGPPRDTQTLDGDFIEVVGRSDEGAAIVDPTITKETVEDPPTSSPPTRTRRGWLIAAAVVLLAGAGVAVPFFSEETNAPTDSTVASVAPKSTSSGDEELQPQPGAKGAKQASTESLSPEPVEQPPPATKTTAARPKPVKRAIVIIRTQPSGVTFKTANGVLLGTSQEGGIRLSSPPLEHGQEIVMSRRGHRQHRIKLGFPASGEEQAISVELQPYPTVRFALERNVEVKLLDTGTALGIGPTEHTLSETEFKVLETQGRLKFQFSRKGRRTETLEASAADLASDTFILAPKLTPKRSRSTSSPRALPAWKP